MSVDETNQTGKQASQQAGGQGAVAYNPFSARAMADPAAAHKELREKCPVHMFREHEPHFTTLTKHDDVLAALKNIEVFSSKWGQGPQRKPAIALFNDPPGHTRFRRLVNTSFTPRAAMALEPMITTLVDELVDAMASSPSRSADLHDMLAMPLPVIVIARMLGVPEEMRETFKEWSDSQLQGMNGNDPEREAKARRAMSEYLLDQAEQRREIVRSGGQLPNDIISEMVEASMAESEAISDAEMLSLLVQILVGGNETTTSLITNLLWRLLGDRELWEAVVADPTLVDVAVEESLRFDPPVLGLYRSTTCPVTMSGVEIPAEEKVMVMYASANRDPAVWDDPDTFRLDRDLNQLRRHLGFGFGIHVCPGAALARTEARIALQKLIVAMPNLRLDGEPERIETFLLWGKRTFPVAW
jgi:cytochrome P450